MARGALQKVIQKLQSGDEATQLQGIAQVSSLGRIGIKAIPQLLELQEQTTDDVTAASRDCIAKMGREAVPLTLQFIRDPARSPRVRYEAVHGLLSFGEQAVPWLIQMLEDAESSIQATAIQGICDLNFYAPELLEPLKHILNTRTPLSNGALQAIASNASHLDPATLLNSEELRILESELKSQVREHRMQGMVNLQSLGKNLLAIAPLLDQVTENDPELKHVYEIIKQNFRIYYGRPCVSS
jgi:HEAT repeat protein